MANPMVFQTVEQMTYIRKRRTQIFVNKCVRYQGTECLRQQAQIKMSVRGDILHCAKRIKIRTRTGKWRLLNGFKLEI